MSLSALALTFAMACAPGELKGAAPVGVFADALALRTHAATPNEQMQAEYWVSRALYGAGLVHIAYGGFAVIASRPSDAATAPVQLMALACLNRIRGVHPSFAYPPVIAARVPAYLALARSATQREAVEQAAISLIFEGAPGAGVLVGALPAHHAAGQLARGFAATALDQPPEAARQLEAFVSNPARSLALSHYVELARLLIARADYRLQRFDDAAEQLKRISRASNELAESLSELAWTQLRAGRYGEAIGTAMSLQVSGLRRTFAPEAPMVLAMAFNEICQYPQSLQASQSFRARYAASHDWLARWAARDSGAPLYPLAVQFLKHSRSPALPPEAVGTEWARSPLFIGSQDEINLIFDERQAARALGRAGAVEQDRLAAEILKAARRKRPKIETIRADLAEFRHLRHAAPAWRRILASYASRVPTLERGLIARINDDLRARTRRMLEQLDEVAENLQLVEVEIYNGASQDIVWQNANPSYRSVAAGLSDADGSRAASATPTWNWGHSAGANDEDEVWEDELGNFKAELFDNCASKERYLALRARIRAQGGQAP